MSLPCKRNYRQRAHSNPIADHCIEYPVNPDMVPWDNLYPHFKSNTVNDSIAKKIVEIADIGCGYGGLLVALSDLYPNTLILGMEIRVKVCEYTQKRISALQEMHHNERYQNIACTRTNAMKYLPNYFKKAQLKKLFFLFPDPHFKVSKHKWRIINDGLLDEYAYILAESGIIYTVTDVYSLHEWIIERFDKHSLFLRIPNEQLEGNDIIKVILESTEESKKVDRDGGKKYYAVFERIADNYSANNLIS